MSFFGVVPDTCNDYDVITIDKFKEVDLHLNAMYWDAHNNQLARSNHSLISLNVNGKLLLIYWDECEIGVRE